MALTISGNPTVSSDGVTIAVTVAGVSGSLSPATGVTGFSLTVAGHDRNFQWSATATNVLTLTLYSPVLTGETVLLSYTPGNLTDGGSNTMSAVTNHAVTNNSTATGRAASLFSIPSGALDAWNTARNGAASNRVEVVVFGDSTTADSGANYSWVYEVVRLAVADGYTYGGRGLLENFDTQARSGPTENLNCISSQTGFDGPGGFFSEFPSFQSTTANDQVTLQFVGTSFRLFYLIRSTCGVFTYSIDGGAAVQLNGNGSGQGTNTLYVSGLSAGSHTLTITNLGYSLLPGPDSPGGGTAGNNSGSPGFSAGTTEYYVVTSLDGSGRESTHGLEGSVTANQLGNQNLSFHWSATGAASYNVYRSNVSGSGYQLIANVVDSGGGFTFFTDDNTATPGAAPPSTSLAQNPAHNECQFLADAMKSTGLVFHKNAVSGATFGTYGLVGAQQSDYFNFPYQVALGLSHEAGVDTGWTAQSHPTNRNPSLAMLTLGINNQQSGQSDTTPITTGVPRFIAACAAAGAIPLVIIPHYSRSGSPVTAKPFIDAAKAACVSAGTAWFDFNTALDAAGYGLGGPHLDQTGYNLEAASIWTNALSLSSNSLTATGTLERGQSGQTITLVASGLSLTNVAGDYALSGGTVTAVANGSPNDATHKVLTVTAPSSDGTITVTFGGTTSGTVTVHDTTAPASPTGVAIGTATGFYSFTLSWNAVSASPAGETITYDVKKNGSTVSSSQAGTTFAVTGAADGDVFAVDARDADGNVSSTSSQTFHAPSGGGGSIFRSPMIQGVN